MMRWNAFDRKLVEWKSSVHVSKKQPVLRLIKLTDLRTRRVVEIFTRLRSPYDVQSAQETPAEIEEKIGEK